MEDAVRGASLRRQPRGHRCEGGRVGAVRRHVLHRSAAVPGEFTQPLPFGVAVRTLPPADQDHVAAVDADQSCGEEGPQPSVSVDPVTASLPQFGASAGLCADRPVLPGAALSRGVQQDVARGR